MAENKTDRMTENKAERIYAIIVAAGKGDRMGTEMPK